MQQAPQQTQATQAQPQLDDPKNPGHALYGQALTSIEAFNAEHGFRIDAQSNRNAAAALAVQAHKAGFTQIKEVALGTDNTKLFAFQGKPGDEFFSRYVSADIHTAHATSVAESSKAYQAVDQHAQQHAAQVHHQEAAQNQPQPVRGRSR